MCQAKVRGKKFPTKMENWKTISDPERWNRKKPEREKREKREKRKETGKRKIENLEKGTDCHKKIDCQIDCQDKTGYSGKTEILDLLEKDTN